MTCAECGAPAEVESEGTATGVDFDGSDAFFALQKVRCAAGHWYSQLDDGKTISLGKEQPC